MLLTILTSTILYIATAVDLLVLLIIYFSKAQTKQHRRQIYIGQYIGSLTLITISLFFAYVLHFVPEKWLLGLLGLIPIYLGIKVAIFGDEDEEEAMEKLDKYGLSKLAKTVALITIASCGADNLGLFIPYFISLNFIELAVTLVIFIILIYIMVKVAEKINQISGIGEMIETYSRWIMAIIYIGLGIYILLENHTFQTLWAMLT
ncbi:CadD family cadmium resistance transporter [Staphylococcus massiliensis]|uniref:Cadmium resistance protein n=1 Tax=Staphylococcus massiliensis S46 TaxID=1229783 RepID=K9AIH9_9STAP|nr:CadD family cadmium resistance transporter [Staphylococcus massiliensis]EKU47099.1 cadmium resistance protein [Staphylococcus massiliensis S46]MCG3398608.1 CadD family cadmium resistance transporter [Staphylococcus massiliensis]MCG3401172.1 CadD family cadmium resistance transporter [Staphylococcus massiliensis]MCG3412310.1 CadD family cadmium resistance transporter [Staphylococcus massiliensis]PNZ97413.1 cadmium transporter [Staphylococcus massiliensis CCUG 55927]